MLNTYKAIEFNTILEQLSDCALSEKAKEKILSLKPSLSESECKATMVETTEAKIILEGLGTPPLASMNGIEKIISDCEKDMMLLPEQFENLEQFISACNRMKSYLKRSEAFDIAIAYFGESFYALKELHECIKSSIRNGQVCDEASSNLASIRRKIENTNAVIKEKLESMLRGNKNWFSDGYIVVRNGRFVLPVKKEYKSQVSGIVMDTSNSGGTIFVEPTKIGRLTDELNQLQIEEENEVIKILYTLTGIVSDHIQNIKMNMECMETLDYTFAKAKLSVNMKARNVSINTTRHIKMIQGRHPLLKSESCIPLDFEIGDAIAGIVITGPNTGGKTVALKTIGLLSLMAQSGLHVPVAEGSQFCMNINVLCDIGDGQSITENLSTFSSHITNIMDILNHTTDESLVLLDELGSGTDPAEGMGIAIAILEELRLKNCLFIATTHYPEVKTYVKNTPKLKNARMMFDRENLKPMYQLEIGEAGESCALYIAKRLGFPAHMIARASQEAYGSEQQIVLPQIDKNAFNTPMTKIKKELKVKATENRSHSFQIGDSVKVHPEKIVGIVCKCTNDKGEIGVQVKGRKMLVNHKRIELLIAAKELYPEDYDFSIIFDTVENRKARHKMEKGHDADLVIQYEEI